MPRADRLLGPRLTCWFSTDEVLAGHLAGYTGVVLHLGVAGTRMQAFKHVGQVCTTM